MDDNSSTISRVWGRLGVGAPAAPFLPNKNGPCTKGPFNPKSACFLWKERIDQIIDIRVLAVLQRTRDDPDEGFQQLINADNWELPVLEVIERI